MSLPPWDGIGRASLCRNLSLNLSGNSHTHPFCGTSYRPVGRLLSDLTWAVNRHSLPWALPRARPCAGTGDAGMEPCPSRMETILRSLCPRGLRHLDDLEMISRWLQLLHQKEERKIHIFVVFFSGSNQMGWFQNNVTREAHSGAICGLLVTPSSEMAGVIGTVTITAAIRICGCDIIQGHQPSTRWNRSFYQWVQAPLQCRCCWESRLGQKWQQPQNQPRKQRE